MPPKVQPKEYIILVKTHKLTVFLTASITDAIASVKAEALEALKAPVVDAPNPHAEFGMEVDDSEEWTVPKVTSLSDFELCRSVKERGRHVGNYEVLDGDALVKNSLVNWEAVFVQFRGSDGELLPVQVSIPTVFDEEDEEAESTARKGKRKAGPDSQ